MSWSSWIENWQKLHKGSAQVLTMNQRNLDFIYPNNARKHFPIADNKLLTKQILGESGIPVPKTYQSYSSFFELRHLEKNLAPCHEFVIKPAHGSGGGGILVISDKTNDRWVTISGHTYTATDLRKHIADIIFGVYSFGLSDQAIIEARVDQHSRLNELSPFGLSDVRIILCHNKPVLSMLRVPTQNSDGKANLHQGALGVGIDIKTGCGIHAIHDGVPLKHHPDTGIALLGRKLPFWDEILRISCQAAQAVPLKYLGVDLAIANDGPLILEINVRPGIGIQNANMLGMRPLLEQIGTPDQQGDVMGNNR